MPINFTDILITVSDLRQRIGGPSNNPNSESYVTDAQLQNIIDLGREEAEELVERKMEALSNEEILSMDSVFSPVNVSVTAGQVTAIGNIPTDNLPVVAKATSNTGVHLEYDNDIHSTGGIYTADCGIVKYRYNIVGNTVYTLPNNSGTVVLHLPTRDEVRQILVADLMPTVNDGIVRKATEMLGMRVKVVQGFKIESQTEAP